MLQAPVAHDLDPLVPKRRRSWRQLAEEVGGLRPASLSAGANAFANAVQAAAPAAVERAAAKEQTRGSSAGVFVALRSARARLDKVRMQQQSVAVSNESMKRDLGDCQRSEAETRQRLEQLLAEQAQLQLAVDSYKEKSKREIEALLAEVEAERAASEDAFTRRISAEQGRDARRSEQINALKAEETELLERLRVPRKVDVVAAELRGRLADAVAAAEAAAEAQARAAAAEALSAAEKQEAAACKELEEVRQQKERLSAAPAAQATSAGTVAIAPRETFQPVAEAASPGEVATGLAQTHSATEEAECGEPGPQPASAQAKAMGNGSWFSSMFGLMCCSARQSGPGRLPRNQPLFTNQR
eukprot:TRINITY_DN36353_c0_g3_i1.p1 TRINITY_DN36353_c0_g3~~TRINITY_DN36353_c0_g3_i1.p1  ORF type:complete len:358 (+),score=88.31 TRINITY_DN36353_c0_g3_i1:114-1187(+)